MQLLDVVHYSLSWALTAALFDTVPLVFHQHLFVPLLFVVGLHLLPALGPPAAIEHHNASLWMQQVLHNLFIRVIYTYAHVFTK
jgi:hypothetical protein